MFLSGSFSLCRQGRFVSQGSAIKDAKLGKVINVLAFSRNFELIGSIPDQVKDPSNVTLQLYPSFD